jgi:hypothetical protein
VGMGVRQNRADLQRRKKELRLLLIGLVDYPVRQAKEKNADSQADI